MEFFEKYVLRTILPDDVIWYRYVDDVLCLWPEDLDLDNFLCQLNNLVPSIEFSIEEEIDFKIPFLDVLIERVEHNFKFTIYRKPTNICSYIHYYSSHALSIKLATFPDFILDKAYNKALTTFNTDKAISPEKIVRNIVVLPMSQCCCPIYICINVCKVWFIYSKLISTFPLFLAIIVP